MQVPCRVRPFDSSIDRRQACIPHKTFFVGAPILTIIPTKKKTFQPTKITKGRSLCKTYVIPTKSSSYYCIRKKRNFRSYAPPLSSPPPLSFLLISPAPSTPFVSVNFFLLSERVCPHINPLPAIWPCSLNFSRHSHRPWQRPRSQIETDLTIREKLTSPIAP